MSSSMYTMGYEDGYDGLSPAYPNNLDYMTGYDDGNDDAIDDAEDDYYGSY